MQLYQQKTWGGSEVRLSCDYLGYLRLKYCLDDLQKVKGRVLDVGCGGGGFAKAIKYYRSDLKVYGADINQQAIKHAQTDAQGVKFSVGDIYHLPYGTGYFNAVVIQDVLEHLQDPYRALFDVNRVLCQRGILHLFVPLEGERYTLHYWLNKVDWKLKERLAGHIQNFTSSEVINMCHSAGFQLNKLRYSGHLGGQVVDVGFYSVVAVSGWKLVIGLEEYLQQKPRIISWLKKLITIFTNSESFLLSQLPGSGIHLSTRKVS